MSADNKIFPANINLTGKNDHRQHGIARQTHFGGLFCFEFEPRINQSYR
ncbi:Hypothetical protein TR210_2396 [Trichococcus ilyis]|uniref:Uncharacterized protein n=1 Tax=Trichococcus ilyis TaxID=640938 RepID=A0A143Z5Z7_9LACT|nr:Hypothetical protein TR210_2396 [Trichococcus ilyis]